MLYLQVTGFSPGALSLSLGMATIASIRIYIDAGVPASQVEFSVWYLNRLKNSPLRKLSIALASLFDTEGLKEQASVVTDLIVHRLQKVTPRDSLRVPPSSSMKFARY